MMRARFGSWTLGVAILSHLKDFAFGRALTPSETATLVAAGVPVH